MNRRLFRLTLFSLAMTLLLASLNLLIDRGQKPLPKKENLTLLNREPTDIDRADIRNQKGEYSIYYDSENGGYVVGNLPTDLVDLERFVDFMVALSNMKAASRAAEKTDDPGKYGLDQPGAALSLRFTDGESKEIRIGSLEPVSQNYYLSVSGDESLYTLKKDLAETLLLGQEAFLSLQVTPKLRVSSPLSAVRDATFSGAAYEAPFSVKAVSGAGSETRLQALSFGTATHLITFKGTHALDQEGGIRLLGSLLDIKAIKVEGYQLTQSELAGYGFDQPDARAEFVLAGSNEKIVLTLKKAGGDTFYAAVDGRDAVYLINRPAFYDIRPSELVLRYLLNPMLMDLSGVRVTTPENEYDIAYERPTGTEGETKVNGKAVSISSFHAFFRLLTSAASDGSLYTGDEPTGAPALSVTYRYKNESKEDDVLQFYPLEARRMAVSINGITELVIRDSFVTRLIQAAEDLKNGDPIEEVW